MVLLKCQFSLLEISIAEILQKNLQKSNKFMNKTLKNYLFIL